MLNGLKKEIIRVAIYNIHEDLGLGTVETITKASLTSTNHFHSSSCICSTCLLLF